MHLELQVALCAVMMIFLVCGYRDRFREWNELSFFEILVDSKYI